MSVGGFWCGLFVCFGVFFVYTLLQLTFDERQRFALQEGCIANDNANFVSSNRDFLVKTH